MTQTELANAEHASPELFRRVAGHWATGVSVTTTIDGTGTPYGLTMSAVSSLSLDPMQFLICVDATSETLPPMLESGLFCVNMLSVEQRHISRAFAARVADRFAGIAWRRLPCGLPVLDGVIAYAACRVSAVLPGGDHRIVVGNLLEGGTPGGEPLLHFRGSYRVSEPLA